MSKFSYKTLLIIFLSLLIAIVVLWKFVLPHQKVSAAWFNDAWGYRKAIPVNNTSGSNLTNFKIKIFTNYDLSALITNGKIKANLADLRFVGADGNQLDYWIEDSTNNSVDIWLKINNLPIGTATVYMYYGNVSAQPGSNSNAAPASCVEIMNSGISTSGLYWIDPDGNTGDPPFLDYCDLTSNGGGYTLLFNLNTSDGTKRIWGDTAFWLDSTSIGNTSSALTLDFKSNAYKNLKLGDELMAMVHNDNTVLYGKALYDVLPTIKGKSLYDIFNSGTNIIISANRKNVLNFTDPDTPSDTFIEEINALKINDKREGDGHGQGVSHTYVRFTTTAGENNPSHNVIGLGGEHDSNDTCGHWGWDYEAQDHQSYCNIYAIGTDWVDKGYLDYNNCPGGQKDIDYAIFSRETTPIVRTTTISSPATEETGGGPIAYWKFDEGVGTTAYDSSSNQNNSILTGTTLPTWASEDQCISGKCISFNGINSYVNKNDPVNNSLDFGTADFTIEFWINYKGSTVINGTFGSIFNKTASNTNSPGLFAGITTYGGNGSNYGIAFSTTNGAWGNGNLEHTGSYTPNTWYHITGVRSGNTFTIYKNGKYGTSVTKAGVGVDISNNENIKIGNGSWGFLNGLIDDFKIYKYARSADQIKLDYNSRSSSKGTTANLGVKSNTSPSLSSKLIANWKFDEGNGIVAYDSSTNQRNITLAGSTLPTWISENQCISGKCLYFDGGNSQAYNTNFDFNVLKQGQETANWTLSIWVKPDGTQAGWERMILGRSGCHGGIYANTTSFDFAIKTDGCWTNAPIISYTPPNMQSWHHLTAVYNSRSMSYYVDGKLIGSDTLSGNMSAYSNTIYIGNIGTNFGFKGYIDEAKIYNTALTDQEILQDYNQGSAIQFGTTNQTIGGTTTSLEYCIPGDSSFCASPVAEWKMDEGVGTSAVDTSGNNNTITLENSPSWNQGKIGKSIQLNGSNQRGNAGNDISPSNITMETWVYRTSTNVNQGIIRKDPIYALSLYNDTIQIAPGNNWSFYNTSLTIPLNTWTHIAYNYDGTTLRVYKNGQLGWSTGLIGTLPSNSNPTYIGYDANGWWWSGKIDHVKIYNYARTSAQIVYDYNKGAPVGWWKMDECQGNTAYDWSGNNNNGTINIGSGGSQTSVGTCTDNLSTSAWNNGKTGKTNSSLNFDGTDDYINLGQMTNFNSSLTNAITISVWAKLDSSVSTNTRGFITRGIFPYFGAFSGTVLWQVNGLTPQYIQSVTPISNFFGKWTHFLVTYDKNSNSNNFRIYINGKLDQQATATGTPNTDPGNILMAAYAGSYTPGQIDDVRIYNYTLTSEQIKTLYNGGAVSFN